MDTDNVRSKIHDHLPKGCSFIDIGANLGIVLLIDCYILSSGDERFRGIVRGKQVFDDDLIAAVQQFIFSIRFRFLIELFLPV